MSSDNDSKRFRADREAMRKTFYKAFRHTFLSKPSLQDALRCIVHVVLLRKVNNINMLAKTNMLVDTNTCKRPTRVRDLHV